MRLPTFSSRPSATPRNATLEGLRERVKMIVKDITVCTQGGSLSDTSSLQAIEPMRSLCILRRRISRMMAICINPCFVVWPRPRKSRPVHFLSQGQRAATLGPWWLVCWCKGYVCLARRRGGYFFVFQSSRPCFTHVALQAYCYSLPPIR